MKVQIIQLEPHDDYISTREKMGWIKTGRIVLVWPSRGRILSRKLDLVLLQRHGKALGVKIAIVTADSDVIYYANHLGIPIFENVRQASGSQWRGKHRKIIHIERNQPRVNSDELRAKAPQHPGDWTGNPLIRVGFFTLGMIALLALVGFFIPSANLTLTPTKKSQQIKINVSASPSFDGVNITGELPAHSRTTIVEGKDAILTTGSMRIPDQFAIGGVRFTNLTEDDIEIPSGTVISTLGSVPIRFSITKEGDVEGGIGKNIILPAQALIPGENGNVPAESILAIEGHLGLKLSVLNPMRTHGGSQTEVPSASTKDITMLNQKLSTMLENTALAEFNAQLDPGEVLLEDSLRLGKIIEENYEPAEGQPANQVELTLQLEYEILVIRDEDIKELANLVLDANLPDRFQAMPNTVEVKYLDEPTVNEDGTIRWRMVLQRETMAIIEDLQAINMILGLPTDQARRLLSNTFDLLKQPSIKLTPDWWPRIPYLPFRVQVSSIEMP